MSSEALPEICLELDERNLAHVLSAVALAALASRIPDALPSESVCWWGERDFVVRTAIDQATLFNFADRFLRTVRWVPGIGGKQVTGKEQGAFVAGSEIGANPFISLHLVSVASKENKKIRSPFKTFAGRLEPWKDLMNQQQQKLRPPNANASWLSQMTYGVSSWGFDCRVGSHAYDQGFSSNAEGTGILDPIYPAVELLSIAAASFFTAIQTWQTEESAVRYAIWFQPISLALVPYATARLLDGFPARLYRAATRGSAYGEGDHYRFFPEAMPDNNPPRNKNERRKRNK